MTPTQLIKCEGGRPKPSGILWSQLSRINLRKQPVLRKLRKKEKDAGIDVTMKVLPRRQRSPQKTDGEEDAEAPERNNEERRPRRQRRGSGRRGRYSENEEKRSNNRSRRRTKDDQSGDESKENVDPNHGEIEICFLSISCRYLI